MLSYILDEDIDEDAQIDDETYQIEQGSTHFPGTSSPPEPEDIEEVTVTTKEDGEMLESSGGKGTVLMCLLCSFFRQCNHIHSIKKEKN